MPRQTPTLRWCAQGAPAVWATVDGSTTTDTSESCVVFEPACRTAAKELRWSGDDLQRRHADRHQHDQHLGGGVGRGIAIGGGVGGLVIVMLALFLGVDPGQVISQQPIQAQTQSARAWTQCRPAPIANQYVDCRVVATGNLDVGTAAARVQPAGR